MAHIGWYATRTAPSGLLHPLLHTRAEEPEPRPTPEFMSQLNAMASRLQTLSCAPGGFFPPSRAASSEADMLAQLEAAVRSISPDSRALLAPTYPAPEERMRGTETHFAPASLNDAMHLDLHASSPHTLYSEPCHTHIRFICCFRRRRCCCYSATLWQVCCVEFSAEYLLEDFFAAKGKPTSAKVKQLGELAVRVQDAVGSHGFSSPQKLAATESELLLQLEAAVRFAHMGPACVCTACVGSSHYFLFTNHYLIPAALPVTCMSFMFLFAQQRSLCRHRCGVRASSVGRGLQRNTVRPHSAPSCRRFLVLNGRRMFNG